MPAHRLLVVALLLNLLVACSACHPPAPGTPEYTLSDPAVVKMRVSTVDEDWSWCTAWKADTNLVVTAGHCCKPENIHYRGEGPHAISGAQFEVLIVDKVNDVCVLSGQISGAPIRLAEHDPQIGARIWTAGYPHGPYLISEGFWSGRDGDGDGVGSVAVYGGASGSPVMDARGRVIGLLKAGYRDMDNLAFMAPIEHVRLALVRARMRGV